MAAVKLMRGRDQSGLRLRGVGDHRQMGRVRGNPGSETFEVGSHGNTVVSYPKECRLATGWEEGIKPDNKDLEQCGTQQCFSEDLAGVVYGSPEVRKRKRVENDGAKNNRVLPPLLQHTASCYARREAVILWRTTTVVLFIAVFRFANGFHTSVNSEIFEAHMEGITQELHLMGRQDGHYIIRLGKAFQAASNHRRSAAVEGLDNFTGAEWHSDEFGKTGPMVRMLRFWVSVPVAEVWLSTMIELSDCSSILTGLPV
ncbi:hypothetical protein CLF_102878 [Clonorchis sinensis]|uniref:Uncharacterized protein n=1 Tax=Clonorchis sinensis TaxID=79923 RepID=G7Y8P8_CLOSI|nr:hypothetical protein CLF_102878 [Clonorchis sinensis]